MSSSRRSSPTDAPLGRCPTCGSERVIRVTEDVEFKLRGRAHRFKAVEHERCEECGERIFGIEASRRFDAVIRRRGGKRAA